MPVQAASKFKLGAREKLAYAEALSTIRGVRYASTLWAATRRKGEYSGLNIIHLIGVGALAMPSCAAMPGSTVSMPS
jgi:hypothetical protein